MEGLNNLTYIMVWIAVYTVLVYISGDLRTIIANISVIVCYLFFPSMLIPLS